MSNIEKITKFVSKSIRKKIKISTTMKHYLHNPHTKYYDWNWCKDEFVPPLTNQELNTYIKNSNKFRNDFLTNLKLYIKLCNELDVFVKKIIKSSKNYNLSTFLSLLFIFQSAMDNHYYKYDYLLDLEEYPKSPLGWHYLKAKKIITAVSNKVHAKNNKTWIETQMLYLLSKKGVNIIKILKKYLNTKELLKLKDSYKALQIFIKTQQEEQLLFVGTNRNSIILKTGFDIWNGLKQAVKDNQKSCFKIKELNKILNGDPIYGTRKILVDIKNYFVPKVVKEVNNEVSIW